MKWNVWIRVLISSNLVPRVSLERGRKRPWLGLVTCLPESGRFQINDWWKGWFSIDLPILCVLGKGRICQSKQSRDSNQGLFLPRSRETLGTRLNFILHGVTPHIYIYKMQRESIILICFSFFHLQCTALATQNITFYWNSYFALICMLRIRIIIIIDQSQSRSSMNDFCWKLTTPNFVDMK